MEASVDQCPGVPFGRLYPRNQGPYSTPINTVGRVAIRASAQAATALLGKLCAEAPFPITGIQVDGGSELSADFERALATRGLTLFALPPKRHQLNGGVKQAQGSRRYELYDSLNVPTQSTSSKAQRSFAHR